MATSNATSWQSRCHIPLVCMLAIMRELRRPVTEFIKQHGYRAQERRRTETGTTCGVTLREIREHLLQKIPELHIGTTTIAYMMAPPHRGHRSAERYKSIYSHVYTSISTHFRLYTRVLIQLWRWVGISTRIHFFNSNVPDRK